jgi:hypothetical protein
MFNNSFLAGLRVEDTVAGHESRSGAHGRRQHDAGRGDLDRGSRPASLEEPFTSARQLLVHIPSFFLIAAKSAAFATVWL